MTIDELSFALPPLELQGPIQGLEPTETLTAPLSDTSAHFARRSYPRALAWLSDLARTIEGVVP